MPGSQAFQLISLGLDQSILFPSATFKPKLSAIDKLFQLRAAGCLVLARGHLPFLLLICHSQEIPCSSLDDQRGVLVRINSTLFTVPVRSHVSSSAALDPVSLTVPQLKEKTKLTARQWLKKWLTATGDSVKRWAEMTAILLTWTEFSSLKESTNNNHWPSLEQ